MRSERAYVCQSGPDLPAPLRHGTRLLRRSRSDRAQHVFFHVRVRRHILWQHSMHVGPKQLEDPAKRLLADQCLRRTTPVHIISRGHQHVKACGQVNVSKVTQATYVVAAEAADVVAHVLRGVGRRPADDLVADDDGVRQGFLGVAALRRGVRHQPGLVLVPASSILCLRPTMRCCTVSCLRTGPLALGFSEACICCGSFCCYGTAPPPLRGARLSRR